MKPRIKLITIGLTGFYGVFVGGLYVWGSSSDTAERAWNNYRTMAPHSILFASPGVVS